MADNLLRVGKSNLYHYAGNNNSSDKKNMTVITVTMKGTSPKAHAEAILDNFGMSQADEQAFKEKCGYDLRQFLTESYTKSDNRTAHQAIGNGYFRVKIPISNELKAQISAVKNNSRPVPTPTPHSNPNEAAAAKTGYDQSSQTRAELQNKLPVSQPTLTPTPTGTPTPLQNTNSVKNKDVSQMSLPEKLQIVLGKVTEHLGPEAAEKFKQLLSPENIAIMVGTTAALIAVQGVPVLDVVVDAAVLGLAIYSLGSEAISAIGDIADFAVKTFNAKTEQDLDDAAKSLAKATATIGVDALAALLIHKGVKSIRSGEIPPPNSRVVEMVTPEGMRVKVRVPVEEPANLKGSNVLESRRTSESSRRNLEIQEQSGGHTIARHVGKSESWLRNRIESENLKSASSFRNEQIANRAQGRFVNRFQTEINNWLKSSENKPLVREFDMNEKVGIVVERGQSGHTVTSKVTVVLVKDSSPQGWHFLTSYPTK